MDQMNWTTRWETWRTLVGTPSSAQRRRVETFLDTRPALLYWGDSWFSTPLYLNLARQSILAIDGMAMLIGSPGATAGELFTGNRIDHIAARVRSSPFDAVCLSAGGNDQLSQRLAKTFADWMPPRKRAKIDADAAFAILLASKSFETIHGRYVALLEALRAVHRARPEFRVFGHGYMPLVRIGAKGDLTVQNIGLIAWLKDDVGPWLWKPMQHVLPDKAEGKRFADLLMLQGFRDHVLRPLAADDAFGDFFSFADFTALAGFDDPGLWHDEIHPTETGFARMAAHLNAHMRARLPERKRGAFD
ncbi:MAG: hypothetical protein ACOY82_06300 [Pseudomonadota bacterium]